MENIFNKIAISTIVILLLFIFSITHISYAQSAEDELKESLTELKEQLGDLNEFKEVMDGIYLELSTATEVTPELKENLKVAIRKMQNINGIDLLIADVLILELEGQVNVLTNENLAEFKSEIRVMREWADEEIKKSENNGSTGGDQNGGNQGDGSQGSGNQGDGSQNGGNQDSGNQTGGSSIENNQNSENQAGLGQGGTKDPTQSGNKLPSAGETSLIVLVTVLLSAIAAISIIKYKQLKYIK